MQIKRKKPNIVVIHNIVSPHVEPLFKELSKDNNLTVFYCAQKEDNRNWVKKPVGFKYKILPNFSLKIKGKDLFTYFINPTIVSELIKINPDVVIVSGWDLFAYQISFLYCLIKKVKLVIWSGSTNYEPSWRRSISLPFVKFMVRNANAYIAYGTRSRDYLVKLGAKKDEIFISYNTTNVIAYINDIDSQKRNIIKTRLGLTNKKVILYYGQIIDRKGVDVLVKAFDIVHSKIKNSTLLLIGDGDSVNRIKFLINKLKIDNVVILPDVGDNKMVEYYKLADVFVLPSREEVWGLVVNQAMASSLPVIVSNSVGSGVDLVKNFKNGFIFDTDNVVDLAKKIYYVLTDEERRIKMCKCSSQFILNLQPNKTVVNFNNAIKYVENEK